MDRLLNDPMAMFGALGGLGALVVTVWMVAGSPASKDKEDEGAAGGFQSAPMKSAAGTKAASEVGSSLKVAKLKDPTAAKEGAEGLKDAGGSASPGSDGYMHGTLAEIEAAEKAKSADAVKAAEAGAAQASGNKKPIPVEVAGGAHVPGSAPDSTKLAAMAQGAIGGAGTLNNSNFAGGVTAGGGAPSASAGFAAGNPASPELGEGGPLVASNVKLAGAAPVGGSRQFARGQAGVGAGPAGAGAARRATGGIGGGGAVGAGAAGGAGPDFSAGGTSFSPGGSGGGGSSGGSAALAGGDALPSAGGGAPKAAGAGGAGLRGAQGQASDNLKAHDRQVSQAGKTELNAQADKHYALAEKYRTGVVVQLVQREKRHALAVGTKLAQASGILGSLDGQLKTELAFFRSYPSALGPLNNSRALIAAGGDSLKGRLDSAKAEMAEGADRVEWVPEKCDFHPVIHENVFRPGFHWGKQMVEHNGQHGWFEDVPHTLDINGTATSGQDLLESAARRAANVRQESQAGIRMVDPEFNPAIEAVTAANAAAGARLAAIAGRIKTDLGRVAALLPEQVSETVAAEASNQGKLQQAALRGHEDIKDLARTVNDRRLGYPDGTARDQLDRNMADASRDSGEALGSVNALTGTSSDTMFVLTDAGRGSTSALQSLCYSRDRLKDLAAKAK